MIWDFLNFFNCAKPLNEHSMKYGMHTYIDTTNVMAVGGTRQLYVELDGQ